MIPGGAVITKPLNVPEVPQPVQCACLDARELCVLNIGVRNSQGGKRGVERDQDRTPLLSTHPVVVFPSIPAFCVVHGLFGDWINRDYICLAWVRGRVHPTHMQENDGNDLPRMDDTSVQTG